MGKAGSWPEVQRGTSTTYATNSAGSRTLFSFSLPGKIFFLIFPLFLSSQLGAVRFDRDLRAITTYLSSQTAFGDVREKFVRIQQIATLLNLDQVRFSFSLPRHCVRE